MDSREYITVVGASYDDDSKDRKGNPILDAMGNPVSVDDLVEKKWQREKDLGRPINHHYILRDSEENRDRLKFTLNLNGIPVIAYMMMSLMKSDLKGKVAIVGNHNVGKIVDKFNKHYSPESFGNEFVYVAEGTHEEWSLANTLKKGTDIFENKQKPVLFLNGDLPHWSDVNSIINDSDNQKYKVVVDLNGRENMFDLDYYFGYGDNGFFQRNYHLKTSEWFFWRQHVKEANMYVFDYETVKPWIDLIYEGRKSATGQNKKVFFDMAMGTLDKKLKTAWNFLTSPVCFAGIIGKFFAKKYISKSGVIPEGWKESTFMKYRAPTRLLQNLASIALGAPVRIKAEHKDSGRVMDIDSWEDWGLEHSMDPEVYEHWNDLKEFAQYEQEFVADEILTMDKNYINAQFAKYEGLKDKQPFDADGNFKNTLWSEEKVAEGVESRRKYNEFARIRDKNYKMLASSKWFA